MMAVVDKMVVLDCMVDTLLVGLEEILAGNVFDVELT